jgi:hypothetical protein
LPAAPDVVVPPLELLTPPDEVEPPEPPPIDGDEHPITENGRAAAKKPSNRRAPIQSTATPAPSLTKTINDLQRKDAIVYCKFD